MQLEEWAHLVFYATVLALCVLSYGDQVHPLIARVDTLDCATRTNIGIQVEHSESQEDKLTESSSDGLIN